MAGHRPPILRTEPTRESFHLMTAKIAYVSGGLTIEEFEASVWHVLNGGVLDSKGRPTEPSPFPEPTMEAVMK